MDVGITLDMGIEVGVNIGGGSAPSPAPESGTVITGTPTVRMSGSVLPVSDTISGIMEEVN